MMPLVFVYFDIEAHPVHSFHHIHTAHLRNCPCLYGKFKGRERNPPPCSRHLGQVVSGCVTLWRQSCLSPPPSPSLLASWEIADRHPNQTICPTRDSCHVLTEIAGQPGTDFSHRGEGVHCTQYTIHCTNI